ncbi:MAG TPA: class II aldolase/adducin family protein, partial [Povalibacter sp.]|nr:class II aldolase/adducin family protein [Povalibacter sp.]
MSESVQAAAARGSPEPDLLENRWDSATAARLSPEELLLYRSNLLGSDRRITNFGGGNTSSKLTVADPLTGMPVSVLWVKGSGGDLGTMKLDGFASLYMEKFLALEGFYQGPQSDAEMVRLYSHCTFNLNPRAASIDTPLHGFVPYDHVDHMHPDAIIAIAASRDSRALTQKIFGDEIGWLPWIRPGYELGLQLRRFVRDNPQARGVILEAHGLFTWGATSQACYENTIDIINRATRWLVEHSRGKQAFGPQQVTPLPPERRREIAASIMPRVRGLISTSQRKVGHFDDSAAVLEFVCSRRLDELAALGTSCPDHFLRTKIWPLVLPFNPATDSVEHLQSQLESAVASYRARYTQYYETCKRPGSPKMRDANAVVYLIPG